MSVDNVGMLYDLPPLLRVFGKRIHDFSMSFRNLGGWISYGYSSYPSYPQYTLDQKKASTSSN